MLKEKIWGLKPVLRVNVTKLSSKPIAPKLVERMKLLFWEPPLLPEPIVHTHKRKKTGLPKRIRGPFYFNPPPSHGRFSAKLLFTLLILLLAMVGWLEFRQSLLPIACSR